MIPRTTCNPKQAWYNEAIAIEIKTLEVNNMAEYILARGNGRHIPHEDKIFGISNRAKAMIAEKGADKVINATIGSLLDDNGNLVVLSSVDEVFKHLSPAEFSFPMDSDDGTETSKEGEDISSSTFAVISMFCSLSEPSPRALRVSQYIVTIVFTLNRPFSNSIPLISPLRLLMAGT